MDKRLSATEMVAQLQDGMTIGIGGWGPRRKPMALVREILRSDLKDLTIVSYGGADVGMLCAAGRVKKLVFAFVSLDFIPLEPYFRQARQSGSIEVMEVDEGMMLLGLRAAAWGLPFIPTEVGLGTDIVSRNPGIEVIDSPYDDKEWVAMPALKLDVALLHLNRADAHGNCQYLGPDPYMDEWFAMAADKTFVTVEKLGLEDRCPHSLLLSSMHVDGVIEAPGGAWFTECPPDYPRDEALQKRYAATASSTAAGWGCSGASR